MYRWVLIILMALNVSAFGDIRTPTTAGGGADADSIKGVPVQDTTGNLSDNDVMTYDLSTNTWLHEAPPGAGGGESNTASNKGTTADSIFYQKSGSDLEFRRLIGSGTVVVAGSGDTALTITGSAHTISWDWSDSSSRGPDSVLFADSSNHADASTFADDVDTTGTDISTALGNKMFNSGDTLADVQPEYNWGQGTHTNIDYIDFWLAGGTPANSEGRLFYEPGQNSMAYYNDEADVTMNIGLETWIRCRNVSGSTILDGKVVYISGAVSSLPTIELAQANTSATCEIIGVATHDIENNTNGYVTIHGTASGINLSDFTDGDKVYLSSTVAGSLSTVAPTAPNCVVEVGTIVNAAVSGVILVNAGKNKQLNSLEDVLISGSPPSAGDILVYDGAVWADTAVLQNYLPLAGGTMAGDINMNQNAILDIRYLKVDTLVVDHDTSYADHIISYLVRLDVHNASGATLEEDTPVYISGATGDTPNIDSARADNAAMMPAIGIVEHDIANGSDGHVIVFGQYGPFNTSAWSVEDPVYVGATGGLTNVKPTGANLIQRIGTVTRDNASQGDIQVVGAGRTNDLPNIASANFWLGNGSGVPTAVTMSGDATMDNAGAVTVVRADSAGAVTESKIGNYIDTTTIDTIAVAHKAVLADSAENVTDGTIDLADHAANSADSTKIVANSLSIPSDLAQATKAELEGRMSDVADFAEADGDIYTNAHDFGGAGSIEIPNGDNPTTDADGEIAWDTDGAIEVYLTGESESALMPAFRYVSIPIVVPDSIQAQTPDFIAYHIKDMLFPFGIEIDSVELQLGSDEDVSVVVEEWSGADPPVFQSIITTIATTGGSDTYAIEAPDNDAVVDANDWIVLDLPTATAGPYLNIGIYYHVTEGN